MLNRSVSCNKPKATKSPPLESGLVNGSWIIIFNWQLLYHRILQLEENLEVIGPNIHRKLIFLLQPHLPQRPWTDFSQPGEPSAWWQPAPFRVLHLLSFISLLFTHIDPSFPSGITQDDILLLWSKIWEKPAVNFKAMFSKPNDKALINHKVLDKNLWRKTARNTILHPPAPQIYLYKPPESYIMVDC